MTADERLRREGRRLERINDWLKNEIGPQGQLLDWLDDLEAAGCQFGRGDQAGETLARPIDAESWLNEPRFARLKYALQYAGSRSAAFPALSETSPEAAAHLFLIMQRGWERYGYLEQAEADG